MFLYVHICCKERHLGCNGKVYKKLPLYSYKPKYKVISTPYVYLFLFYTCGTFITTRLFVTNILVSGFTVPFLRKSLNKTK